MENKTTYSFEDFENIIARLRAKDGCPWDQVQTHESLRDGMLEEAYEVVEGIDIYQATGMTTISVKNWEMCCSRLLCMRESPKRKDDSPWRTSFRAFQRK